MFSYSYFFHFTLKFPLFFLSYCILYKPLQILFEQQGKHGQSHLFPQSQEAGGLNSTLFRGSVPKAHLPAASGKLFSPDSSCTLSFTVSGKSLGSNPCLCTLESPGLKPGLRYIQNHILHVRVATIRLISIPLLLPGNFS